MMNYSEICVEMRYGRLFLQRVEMTETTAIAIVYVPEDINVMSDSRIRKCLLGMKEDLTDVIAPQEITFVLFQGERTFVSGVDNCQRFCCEIKDLVMYKRKLFCSKKADWLSKMIEATETERKIESYETERKVVGPEEAILTLQRLGVI